MIDFLRSNPFVTKEQFMWEWTVPQIKIASYDYTHVVYLSEKQAQKRKIESKTVVVRNPLDLVNDFGVPIFKPKKKKD
jgi:hypothetical protein